MKLPWYLVEVDGPRGLEVRPRAAWAIWVLMAQAVRLWFTARVDRWPVNTLGDARWFRRWIGGHWECWYLDVVHSELWFRMPHGSERPPLGRGTPHCEDWPVSP